MMSLVAVRDTWQNDLDTSDRQRRARVASYRTIARGRPCRYEKEECLARRGRRHLPKGHSGSRTGAPCPTAEDVR